MRRILGVCLGLLILGGCNEPRDSSLVDPTNEEAPPPEEEDSPPGTSNDLYDGSPGASTDNPYFFFLPPLVETPGYSGVAEAGLEPVVSICPLGSWDSEAERCDPESTVASFSARSANPEDRVVETSGLGYSVTWNTRNYPAQPERIYRVSVSVVGQLIGYVDVLAFLGDESCDEEGRGQRECEPRAYDPTVGYAAFYHRAFLEIGFRIEEGAIESEYCDPTGVEDCDVALFTYETGGCLRVYENPGQTGEALGSQVCVPGGAAELEGVPVDGPYAVILTLEKDDAFQGTGDGFGQVPFFPDLRTDPPGISFADESEGIDLVICQAVEGTGTVPEELHSRLRPFLIFADGSVRLPGEFSFGAPECEGFDDHAHPLARGPDQSRDRGVLGHLAAGLGRVSRLFLPEPLNAFRLHGGLNTTVYDTRGDRDGGGRGEGDNAPRPGSDQDEEPTQRFVVEAGAVLDVDLQSSGATLPGEGRVGIETVILIHARDAQGNPFPFDIPVEVEITGANPGILIGSFLARGEYVVSYTPGAPGADDFTIHLDGLALPGPFASTVQPVPADAGSSSFAVDPSEVGAPTRVTVSVMDENGQPYLSGRDFPVPVSVRVTDKTTGELAGAFAATDDDGAGNYDGTYEATFTPEAFGSFEITVTVDGQATPDSPESLVIEALPADPAQSGASATEGILGEPTIIFVVVVNTAGRPYDYGDFRPILVEVSVNGANSATFLANDPDRDGTFTGSYTPSAPGQDHIQVTIDGVPIPGSLLSEVDPLTGELVVAVTIPGPVPSDGLPVELYLPGGASPFRAAVTDANGMARFRNIDLGTYIVHLPKRDFDVEFVAPTQVVTHQAVSSQVTIDGQALILPADAVVWRIRDGGNGNAYRYRKGGGSWSTARSLAQAELLHGESGHLATIASRDENDLVHDLFRISPDLCPSIPDLGDCTILGWIGLSDNVQEGQYRWVTGEPLTFTRWVGVQKPLDPLGDQDFVQIDAQGLWSIANLPDPSGVSMGPGPGPQRVFAIPPANEGHFVEWEVRWPVPPSF